MMEQEKQEIVKCPNYTFAAEMLSKRIHKCLKNAQNILILGPIPNSGTRDSDGSYTHHIYYQQLKRYLLEVLLKGKSFYDSKSIEILAHDTTLISKFVHKIVVSSAFDFFNNEMVLEDNESWFENLGLVIFENVTDFVTFNRHWQGLISNYLYKFANFDIIYLAAERSKIEDGIRSEFDSNARTKEATYNNNNSPIGFLYFTAWNRENYGKLLQHKWTKNNQHFAGIEPVIHYKAFQLNSSSTYRMNYSKNMPYEDYIEEIEKEFNDFRKHIEIDYLQFQRNNDKRFIATDDIYNNISYVIYRHRLPRNGKMYINVCSTPYLFRDYIAANIAYFNQYVMFPLSPIVDRNSKRNTLLLLFELLRRNSLSQKRICEFLNIPLTPGLCDILRKMYYNEFDRSFDKELSVIFKKKEHSSWEKEEFIQLKIDSDELLDTRTELFKVVDVDYQTVVFDKIPKDLIIPYFTSRERYCYKEKNFRVDKIDYYNKQVLMKKDTVGAITEVVYYSKVSNNIKISDITEKNNLISEEIKRHIEERRGLGIEYALCDLIVSDVEIEPLERYDFTFEYDYSRANIIKKSILEHILIQNNSQNNLHRHYTNEKILFFHLNVKNDCLFPIEKRTELIAKVSATLTYLLKNAFESFLPDSYMFLDVLCLNSYELKDSYYFNSKVTFNQDSFDKDAINIAVVEDAIQDLGLLKAIQENFKDIMLYLDDFLQWYLSQATNMDGLYSKPVNIEPVFKIKGNSQIQSNATMGEPVNTSGSMTIKIDDVEFGYEGLISDKIPRQVKTDLLKINNGSYPSFFELDLTKNVLSLFNSNKNDKTLKRFEFLTRKEIGISQTANSSAKHQCDFCGTEVFEEEMDVFIDGRERCAECRESNPWDNKDVVTKDIDKHIDNFFSAIKQSKPIENLDVRVTFTNIFNKNFTPTRYFDPRAIGLAVFKDSGEDKSFEMYVENGMPEKQSILTTIHEWTHIWQYNNLDYYKMNEDYNKLLIEGHSVWSEIFYASQIMKDWGNKEYWENYLAPLSRKDEYGDGYRLIHQLLVKHDFSNPFDMLLAMYPLQKK